MNKIKALLLGMGVLSAVASAQLTTDQRVDDFRNLASLYSYMYGPYEWKRDLLKYDALNISPWLERVRAVKDDLAYYELCVEYVAGLNDAHDEYLMPSTFSASLGFTVDIYDGKVLVDSISRTRLPAEQFKFEIGDELVSVDGKPVEELMKSFEKYSVAGNPLSTRRFAAARLVRRSQAVMPHAHEIGDSAEVVVRRAGGDLETYTIPWLKTGVALTSLAPGRPLRAGRPQPAAEDGPAYLRPLRARENFRLPDPPAVLGSGALRPIFDLPEGFVVRLGTKSYDAYYSGTFEAGGFKIGYIRIPDFMYRSRSGFEKEIAYFQLNTDGLIVDIMRNPGGMACTTGEALLARLIPTRFRELTQEARVAWTTVLSIAQALDGARREGADESDIAALESLLKEYEWAYRENGGRTRPLPLCGSMDVDPATDSSGNGIAYTKPILVLVDEMSASSADIFAAVIQDNQRGLLFGMRTMGAGGAVADGIEAGVFSEGEVSVTMSLVSRKDPVATPDYPTSAYIENIGVRPDVVQDYMTRENLMNRGKPFVDAFVAKMVERIQASR